MKIKSIIARFLPLLDVAILLLGLMIVLMTFAHFEKQSEAKQNMKESSEGNQGVEIGPHVEFVFLHVAPDGRCYMIESGKDTNEIDITSDKDIRPILDALRKKTKLIFLVSKSGEIDTDWTYERINRLKTDWKLNEENEVLCRLTSVPF